ncbi:hypothetical protein ACFFRR_004237 [Megaselia abdita]
MKPSVTKMKLNRFFVVFTLIVICLFVFSEAGRLSKFKRNIVRATGIHKVEHGFSTVPKITAKGGGKIKHSLKKIRKVICKLKTVNAIDGVKPRTKKDSKLRHIVKKVVCRNKKY